MKVCAQLTCVPWKILTSITKRCAWRFITLSRSSTVCSFGTCTANAAWWRPVILNDIYLVSFIMLVAILAQQSPYATEFFLKYKHEKVETIVFQAVVSHSCPSTVLAYAVLRALL